MRLPALLAAAGVAALAVAGPAALGRLALMAGLPSLAAPLIADPAVRGVALYEAGKYAAADDAFREGRAWLRPSNRGLSLVSTGALSAVAGLLRRGAFSRPRATARRANPQPGRRPDPAVVGDGNEFRAHRGEADRGPPGRHADDETRGPRQAPRRRRPRRRRELARDDPRLIRASSSASASPTSTAAVCRSGHPAGGGRPVVRVALLLFASSCRATPRRRA